MKIMDEQKAEEFAAHLEELLYENGDYGFVNGRCPFLEDIPVLRAYSEPYEWENARKEVRENLENLLNTPKGLDSIIEYFGNNDVFDNNEKGEKEAKNLVEELNSEKESLSKGLVTKLEEMIYENSEYKFAGEDRMDLLKNVPVLRDFNANSDWEKAREQVRTNLENVLGTPEGLDSMIQYLEKEIESSRDTERTSAMMELKEVLSEQKEVLENSMEKDYETRREVSSRQQIMDNFGDCHHQFACYVDKKNFADYNGDELPNLIPSSKPLAEGTIEVDDITFTMKVVVTGVVEYKGEFYNENTYPDDLQKLILQIESGEKKVEDCPELKLDSDTSVLACFQGVDKDGNVVIDTLSRDTKLNLGYPCGITDFDEMNPQELENRMYNMAKDLVRERERQMGKNVGYDMEKAKPSNGQKGRSAYVKE